MSFEPIREKIKSNLQAISSIQEVYDYQQEEYNGYPVAVLLSEKNEADFESTAENKRVYVFSLWIIQECTHMDKKTARRTVEGVIDDVIKSFDEDPTLTGVSLPSTETMLICYPVLSSIENDERFTYAKMEIKVLISCNIT